MTSVYKNMPSVFRDLCKYMTSAFRSLCKYMTFQCKSVISFWNNVIIIFLKSCSSSCRHTGFNYLASHIMYSLLGCQSFISAYYVVGKTSYITSNDILCNWYESPTVYISVWYYKGLVCWQLIKIMLTYITLTVSVMNCSWTPNGLFCYNVSNE